MTSPTGAAGEPGTDGTRTGRSAPSDPLLPEEEDAVEDDVVEDVPAGGAGGDSGAAETVRIDPTDTAEVPDRSVHNDEPGVGTPDGGDRRTEGV